MAQTHSLLLLMRVPQVLGILLRVSQNAHFRQREVKAAWVFFWAPEHIEKSPLCCSECEWGRPVNWVQGPNGLCTFTPP